jgi:hypothetical protein
VADEQFAQLILYCDLSQMTALIFCELQFPVKLMPDLSIHTLATCKNSFNPQRRLKN